MERKDDDQGEEAEAADQAEAPDEEPIELPGGDDLPPIDFNTFVLSMSTSVLVNLGAAPDPSTGQVDVDLAVARQTVDLLGLIEEKTRGNLTGEEERLLTQVLYELRMRFVATWKKTE